MSKNKRNFIITELLLGVLLVIGIGFIAYNKLNEKTGAYCSCDG